MCGGWKASAAGGRKEIQVFRHEIQAEWNKFQIRRNEIQIETLAFLRRIEPFQSLTPTPRAISNSQAARGRERG